MTSVKTWLASALLATAFAAQAQTIQVEPTHANVTVGDEFTLDIAGVAFPDKIVGGGYDIAYDTALLDLVKVTIPGIWEFAVSEGTADEVAGTVTDVFFNTFSNPRAGDFLTATLTFRATGVGDATVDVKASGSFPFGNEVGEAVPVSFSGGMVHIAAVPEPSTWALLLAGLGTAALVRRRRAG